MNNKNFFTKEVPTERKYRNYENGMIETEQVMEPHLRIGRIVTCAIALLLIIILALSSIVIIKAGHTGVVSTFGKVSENVLQEGLNIKAPWQKVTKMDNRIVKLEVSTEAFSSDLQTVSVNLAVGYRVDPSKSHYIIKNIGKKYEDVLITPAVHEVMKSIVARYTAEKSIANRNEISQALLNELGNKLISSGIYISDINIIDFDFSDTYINAIEAKQVAEQELQKARTQQEQLTMEQEAKAKRQKIEAEAEAEVARIEAEAAAEVTRINADAIAYAGQKEAEANKEIAASLTAELVEYKKIEQWNGKLPEITGVESVIAMD